jgi:hypothetical protein
VLPTLRGGGAQAEHGAARGPHRGAGGRAAGGVREPRGAHAPPRGGVRHARAHATGVSEQLTPNLYIQYDRVLYFLRR